MQYNIHFELCSLCFLFILIIFFFVKRKHIQKRSRIYAIYLIFIFIDITLDIVTSLTSVNPTLIPLTLNNVLNFIFLFLQICIPCIFLTYILSLTDLYYKKISRFLYIPTVLCLIILLLTPFTKAYYYFDTHGFYQQGAYQVFLYVNGAFCMIAGLLISYFYKKNIGKDLFITSFAIALITISGLIIQYYNREVLITGLGMVISLLILYFSFENPDYYTDLLTQVMNRNAFISELDNTFLSRRHFQVLVISIDDFKSINDIFGIMNGDRLLKSIADYLKKLTPDKKVYRINGDIFALILFSSSQTQDLSERLQTRFHSSWNTNNMSLRLEASFCLLYSHLYDNDSAYLMKMIDYAIIESKKQKKGTILYVDENVSFSLHRKTAIEKAIYQAIEKRQLEIQYQPIYSTKYQNYTSIEALVRLNIDPFGYIPPDEFIQYSEENGSIIPLGYLIIETVFQFIKEYDSLSSHILSINLSAIQCMQEDFAKNVINLCHQYHIDTHRIYFELTETAAILEQETLVKNMKELEKFGIRFSLDDYGTGYSTIQYIMNLPFHSIKLDKSIIYSGLSDSRTKIILISTIQMLQKLHYNIVAEGIETCEQANFLINLGVHELQGYYYSKPLKKEELFNKITGLENQI